MSLVNSILGSESTQNDANTLEFNEEDYKGKFNYYCIDKFILVASSISSFLNQNCKKFINSLPIDKITSEIAILNFMLRHSCNKVLFEFFL
jgi:hypothetical protein